jgi:hypothetical protein
MSKTIIRARRRHRFLILDQRAVEDTRLSWAARGLLAYLLSRPDDWKTLVNDLRKRGDLGRDGIYKLLKELRTHGYACYEQNRDSAGRIRGGSYIIQEIPDPPHPVLPDVATPNPAEPHSAKPDALPTTDKDLKRTTTTKPTTTNNPTRFHDNEPYCVEFPSWIPEEFKPSAADLINALNPGVAQLVIDEWAALLAIGAIHTSPLGYLYALVKRLQSGEHIRLPQGKTPSADPKRNIPGNTTNRL